MEGKKDNIRSLKDNFYANIQNNVEYRILPYQFILLTFWGIWCPKDWSIKMKKAHYCFFFWIYFLDSLICIEMLIYFLSSIGTDKFKLLNLFFLCGNITAVYKAVRIMQIREIIRSFIHFYFNTEWINLRDFKEHEIDRKVNCRIRNITIMYSASMVGIVIFKALSPLMESSSTPLPVDAIYPYSIENSKWFWVTYLHQVLLGSSAVSTHIAVDTLFVGLLLKTSAQINLLKHRLQNSLLFNNIQFQNINLVKHMQRKKIIECIRHHERILRFGTDLNIQFQELMMLLVIFSIPNICINVYSLSAYTDDINVQYVATFFATTSALLQFFIVCWFGNEVMLDSQRINTSVIEMNWANIDISSQKLILVMMTRAAKPMKFSVGYVVPMNLDSFIKIVKTSYTAFNLLQRKKY